jgi:hypothetical protein
LERAHYNIYYITPCHADTRENNKVCKMEHFPDAIYQYIAGYIFIMTFISFVIYHFYTSYVEPEFLLLADAKFVKEGREELFGYVNADDFA